MKRIIYQTPEGGVAVIIPSGEIPIEEVCRKDVPAGVAYKIVDTVDVPSDRTFRAAWETSIDVPDGHGIGPNAWFIEQFKKQIEDTKNTTAPQKLEDMSDEDYKQELVSFEAAKASRIEWLNKHIAIQEAEMNK